MCHHRRRFPCRFTHRAALAEFASVQLEFKALSYHTTDPQYRRRVERAMNVVERALPAQRPATIGPGSGPCVGPVWPRGGWRAHLSSVSTEIRSRELVGSREGSLWT